VIDDSLPQKTCVWPGEARNLASVPNVLMNPFSA